MKYEIEIDDSLVPEGKVPVRLIAGRSEATFKPNIITTQVTYPVIEFKDAHDPKIPDFVPEGWWITKSKTNYCCLWSGKPTISNDGYWGHANGAVGQINVLVFDRDALFGDLPPEQCCFQQKGNG